VNDFISLICPSCGGRLEVSKNSPTYTCEYCGQTHKLREEDIESFGRCLKCHRNDRVEKITAIVNKNDPLAKKFRPPKNLKAVRYHRLLDSTKMEKPLDWITIDENQESIYSIKSKRLGLGSLFSFIICIFLFLAERSDILNFLGILTLLGSIILLVPALVNSIKGKQDLNKYKNELLEQKAIQTKMLMKRYDEIYYCHRDDLLFVPGEAGFASSSDFENFIIQVLETKQA